MVPWKVGTKQRGQTTYDVADERIFSWIKELKALAFGYSDMDEEIIQSLSLARKGDIKAFSKAILETCANKNTGSHQRQVSEEL